MFAVKDALPLVQFRERISKKQSLMFIASDVCIEQVVSEN